MKVFKVTYFFMLHAAILQTNDKNNEIAEISVGSGLAKQDCKHEICKKKH